MTPDHDLLIELRTKLDGLINSVNTITLDHETRLRGLEQMKWKLIGGLLIIQAVGGWSLYWVLNRLH